MAQVKMTIVLDDEHYKALEHRAEEAQRAVQEVASELLVAKLEEIPSQKATMALVRIVKDGTPQWIEIDPSQAWFWTPEWQAAERAADEDLRAGRYTDFPTMDELIADLDEP